MKKETSKVISVRLPKDVYDNLLFVSENIKIPVSRIASEILAFGIRSVMSDELKGMLDKAVKKNG